jgi:hypothetical protein
MSRYERSYVGKKLPWVHNFLPENLGMLMRNRSRTRGDSFIPGITYAGNHGLEILHPDGSKFVHPMPAFDESRGQRLKERLKKEV